MNIRNSCFYPWWGLKVREDARRAGIRNRLKGVNIWLVFHYYWWRSNLYFACSGIGSALYTLATCRKHSSRIWFLRFQASKFYLHWRKIDHDLSNRTKIENGTLSQFSPMEKARPGSTKNPILFSMKICSDCHLLLVWNPAMWIEIISGYRISLGCWKSELSAELFPRNIIGDMVTGNERFAKLINFNFSCPQKMILYNVEASVVRIMRRQQTRMRGEKMKRQNHFSERILEILFWGCC